MDFDRYGIEEWSKARPEQLARGYANAVADEKLLVAFLKKLKGRLKRRQPADAGADLLTAHEV